MEVSVKARFNASQERFETFGRNKYLLYLPFSEDEDAEKVLISVLSKHLGVSEKAIQFKTKNSISKDWVFYIH